MPELKRFDATGKCLKCGHHLIHAAFHAGHAACCTSCHRYGCDGPAKEHLRRRCERCGFEWNEATLAPAEESDRA